MKKMKITKSQLKQIIKEELTNVVSELGGPVPHTGPLKPKSWNAREDYLDAKYAELKRRKEQKRRQEIDALPAGGRSMPEPHMSYEDPELLTSLGESDIYEDEEVRGEFEPDEYDLDPEAEQFGARDPEQDEQTMQDINDMYNELIVDLEDVEDPRMKAKLIKLFQGALESEGEVFELEP